MTEEPVIQAEQDLHGLRAPYRGPTEVTEANRADRFLRVLSLESMSRSGGTAYILGVGNVMQAPSMGNWMKTRFSISAFFRWGALPLLAAMHPVKISLLDPPADRATVAPGNPA